MAATELKATMGNVTQSVRRIFPMQSITPQPNNERWRQLAQQLQEELDPERIIDLAQDLIEEFDRAREQEKKAS
jgi:hypothetical protein